MAISEARKKTFDYWCKRSWYGIRHRTSGRYSHLPTYAVYARKGIRNIFRDYLSFKAFVDALLPDWERLVQQGDRPSLDRIDPNGHYEPSNLRLISAKENIANGFRALKFERSMRLIAIDLNSGLPKFFESQAEARRNGFHSVSRTLRGDKHRHTVKGHVFLEDLWIS